MRALRKTLMMRCVRDVALVVALLVAPVIRPAHAVSVQSRTAPGNSLYMLNESGQIGYRGPFFVGIDYNVLNDPLVELSRDEDRRTRTLLDGLQTFDLTGAFNVADRISLNATMPLNVVHADGQGRSWAFGDMRLFVKVPLLERRSDFQLSLVPELRLNTGDAGLFVSDDSTGFGLLVAAEQRFRYFSVVGNLGYRRAADAQFRELDYRQRIPYSVGVSVPLGANLSVGGEFAGARVLPFNGSQNPSELYAGARYQVVQGVAILGGGSVGTLSDVPSANYRLMLGLKFEPFPENRPVGEPSQSSTSVAVASLAEPQLEPVEAPGRVDTSDRGTLDLSEPVQFAHDSAALTPSGKRLLNEVAEVIVGNPDRIGQVHVEGHTNDLGSDEYNLGLSRRRAHSVAAYLGGRTGHPEQLDTVGYGESRPKEGSDQLPRAESLRVNRRVEFRYDPPAPPLATR